MTLDVAGYGLGAEHKMLHPLSMHFCLSLYDWGSLIQCKVPAVICFTIPISSDQIVLGWPATFSHTKTRGMESCTTMHSGRMTFMNGRVSWREVTFRFQGPQCGQRLDSRYYIGAHFTFSGSKENIWMACNRWLKKVKMTSSSVLSLRECGLVCTSLVCPSV